MTGPLDGILVADFSWVLAAPMATMLLGDLGAEVVKVERPGAGDETRAWGPPFVDGQSAYFLAVNRNKRSIALDLASVEGRRAAVALAARADVLVENFRPGTMERLGLDYETLRERNPGLVYCSVSGFGSGAGAALPGYDFLVQALGGLMSITGEPDPDGEPVKVGVALVDVLTGMYLLTGTLAALYERQRSGHGQRVEVNLLSSILAGLVNQASTYVTTGQVPGRMGNQHPSIAPYETLRAADRPVAVAVGNDGQFARLCEALGAPQLAADPRFADNAGRVTNRAALVAELERHLAARPAAEWVAVLGAASVPCGLVNDLDEAFALAERLGLAPITSLGSGSPDSPGGPGGANGASRQVANPIRLSATPPRYRRPPPQLGEHTAEVMGWLGLGDADEPGG